MAGLKLRRAKHLRRQSRVAGEERELRKQSSAPAPASAPPPPALQKHGSYPQYRDKNRRSRTQEHEEGSLLIRAVSGERPERGERVERAERAERADACEGLLRASHTPAVRAGPPLSCNFCWNTVDDSGRILRRKTQYHCPECRKNLCIVPCFHEYHEDAPEDAAR